jgi:uncharacterized protein
MKPIFYLLIITLSLVLVGCDNNIDESELVVRNDIHYQINSDKPFTGSVTSYHENGQKKNLGTYKKGLKDGLSEESSPNGQLLSSVNYFMGGKEGVENTYDENGNLRFVNNYKSSLLDGLRETYFKNGQLKLQEIYQNGQLKEKIVSYDESGNEIRILSFSRDDDYNFTLLSDSEVVIRIEGNTIREGKIEGDGLREHLRKSNEEPFNGLLVSYLNGNLFYRGLVKNGLENGPYEIYYENGQLRGKESYLDGKREGPFEQYHENGQLSVEGSFKDGKQDGSFESYHENGQLQSNGSYKDGKQDGPFETYDENGQLESKGSYKDDEKDGPLEQYHENGQLKFKKSYKYGKLEDGPFEIYDENGQLKEKGSYKDDERDGPYEVFFAGMRLEQFYKGGKRHGLQKWFLTDGSISDEECYQNGEKVDLTVCESK